MIRDLGFSSPDDFMKDVIDRLERRELPNVFPDFNVIMALWDERILWLDGDSFPEERDAECAVYDRVSLRLLSDEAREL